jgi:hypothetical protein
MSVQKKKPESVREFEKCSTEALQKYVLPNSLNDANFTVKFQPEIRATCVFAAWVNESHSVLQVGVEILKCECFYCYV